MVDKHKERIKLLSRKGFIRVSPRPAASRATLAALRVPVPGCYRHAHAAAV